MRKQPILLLAGLIATPAALGAQRLESGTWSGTVTPPGEAAVPVTYAVRQTTDSLSITITANGIGSFPLRNVKIADGKMTFDWSPGDAFASCQLTRREDGSWGGACQDNNGGMGAMTMVPPKKPGTAGAR